MRANHRPGKARTASGVTALGIVLRRAWARGDRLGRKCIGTAYVLLWSPSLLLVSLRLLFWFSIYALFVGSISRTREKLAEALSGSGSADRSD